MLLHLLFNTCNNVSGVVDRASSDVRWKANRSKQKMNVLRDWEDFMDWCGRGLCDVWQSQSGRSWQKRNEWILKEHRGESVIEKYYKYPPASGHCKMTHVPKAQTSRRVHYAIYQWETRRAARPSLMLPTLMSSDIRSDLLCTGFIKVALNGIFL